MNKRLLIKISIIAAVVIITITVPLLAGLTKITGIDLSIQYPDNSIVLSKTDIQQYLFDKYGDFTNYRRNQIKTEEIKTFLENKEFIDHSVVSVSITGILRITVIQKQVLVRVFTSKGKQFYIDKNMNIVHSQNPNEVAKCITATGNISEYSEKQIDSVKNKDCYYIYLLATLINNDSLLKTWISGIRKQNKQWILLPSQGDYNIILGENFSWKDELQKLHYLIEFSFQPNGWNDYEYIDLRFHNQVICSKKI